MTDPGYNAYAGWSFQAGAPAMDSQSTGGDMHAYYVRFVGPNGVLAEQAAKHPEKFIYMADGDYYVPIINPTHPFACSCGCKTPEAHVYVALKKLREIPTYGWMDGLSHDYGFVVGLGAQAVDDVVGLAQLARVAWEWNPQNPYGQFPKLVQSYTAVSIGNASTEQCEFVAGIGTKSEEMSNFIKGAKNLWQDGQQSQWGTLAAAASGDWEEANRQSETMRWMMAYSVELAVAIENQYAGLTPFERGKLEGRITLEVAMIVLPFTKAANVAQASKLTVLTRLSEVGWIQENAELCNVVKGLIKIAEGKEAVPPIIGLPAVDQIAATVGTEAAGEAERVWGAYAAKVASGKSKNLAAMEAMRDVGANTDGMKIAFRFKQMSDVQRAKMPFSPTAAEYDEFLTMLNWNAVKAKKGFSVVENGETFWVVGGAQGYEGNHIVTKALQEALQGPPYNLPITKPNASPVGILTKADHQFSESAFHKLLDKWKGGIFSDNQIRFIVSREG